MKIAILPSKPGVYCFINICNGKRYIGQSNNLRKRYNTHRYQLKNGRHHNKHLQRAWNKYGENNFKYIILQICKDSDHAIEREQYWANKYNSFIGENGYNTGECLKVWNTGIKYSKYRRKKISILQKSLMTPERLHMLKTMNIGRKFGEDFRKKIRYNFLGIKHTKKTKKTLSIAQVKFQASLSKSEKRKTFKHRMKTIRLVSPDGKFYEITGMRGFCEEFKLDRAAISRVLIGKNKHHLGWKAFLGEAKDVDFIIKKY